MSLDNHMAAINQRVKDGGVVWIMCACGREWPYPKIGMSKATSYRCEVCLNAEQAQAMRRLETAIRYAEESCGALLDSGRESSHVQVPNHEAVGTKEDTHDQGRGSN